MYNHSKLPVLDSNTTQVLRNVHRQFLILNDTKVYFLQTFVWVFLNYFGVI